MPSIVDETSVSLLAHCQARSVKSFFTASCFTQVHMAVWVRISTAISGHSI